MENGKRILITGISGTDLNPSLIKFAKYCAIKGNPIEKSFDLNSYVHKYAREKYNDISWFEVLGKPNPDLRSFWVKAMKEVKKIINNKPECHYIIYLHACFYHQYTQEFISYLDIPMLSCFKSKDVITLIDDIDDIHIRLKEDGQIFCESFLGASFYDVANILELKKIIDWRSNEILISRLLADVLAGNHFILAVKHPMATLYKLIFEKEKYYKIYVSHPITKIRELLFNNSFKEAQDEINPIKDMINLLSQHTICFFPTAIDEFRLRIKEGNLQYSGRWMESDYSTVNNDLLFIPNPNKKHLPYSKDSLAPYTDPLSTPTVEEKKKIQMDFVIESLLHELNEQIGIRDKMLVEHCDFLYVYRPYLNGKISTGVKREMDYIKMIKPTSGEKLGIVFFPEEDYKETKISQVREGLKKLINVDLKEDDKPIFILKREKDFVDLVKDEFGSQISENFENNLELITIVQNIITCALHKNILIKNPLYSNKALNPQNTLKMKEIYKDFVKLLINSYNNQIKPIKDSFFVYSDKLQHESMIQKIFTKQIN
jgi:hypothetical protein